MVPETFEEFVPDYIECVPEEKKGEVTKGLSKLGVLCPVHHGGIDSLALVQIVMSLEERFRIVRIPPTCTRPRKGQSLKVFDIYAKLVDAQRKGRLRFVAEE